MTYDQFCEIIYKKLYAVKIVKYDYEVFCLTNKRFLLPNFCSGRNPNDLVSDLIDKCMTLR